ncbi:MAG: oxidoreductase [Stackebrandtia sp.]
MTHPLAPLLELADVAEALEGARDAVGKTLWNRRLRRHGAKAAAEVSLRCAASSAALEGTERSVEEIRSGTVVDPNVQGALRVGAELPALIDVWPKAPRQALARLHLAAARGLADEESLGRPRLAAAASARLEALCDLAAGDAAGVPATLTAAVVHGELLALRAFPTANGLVARAAARLELASRGLDPSLLIAVDVGHARRAPEYVGAAGAFATGTVDGLRSWLKHCAQALAEGAAVTDELVDDLT